MISFLVWLGLRGFLGGRTFNVTPGTTDGMVGHLGRNDCLSSESTSLKNDIFSPFLC